LVHRSQIFPQSFNNAMAKGKSACLVLVALVGASNLWKSAFVPPARSSIAAASAVATLGAAPAFADSIDAAAKKLAAASYPFLSGIDWNSEIYSKLPGADNQKLLKAVDKALVMGAAMDGKALSAAAMAHHKAIGSMNGKGVTSQADYEAVLANLGKAIASVPEATTLDTFNAYKALINSPGEFPQMLQYLQSKIANPADAYAAGGAFLEFADVVKKAR